MLKQYLVGNADHSFSDESFTFVEALNPAEAIEKAVTQVEIYRTDWLENIYDRAVNMSFAELFWIQGDEEHDYFCKTGNIKIYNDEFERRVRKFFNHRQDFAQKYLDFTWDIDDHAPIEDLIEKEIFPPEMMYYMMENSDWNTIIAIPFEQIKKIK